MYYAYDPLVDEDEYDGVPTKRLCVEQTTIRFINHQLQTITSSKVALSCMDDKRVWINANMSLPYGHCDSIYLCHHAIILVYKLNKTILY